MPTDIPRKIFTIKFRKSLTFGKKCCIMKAKIKSSLPITKKSSDINSTPKY